MELVASVCNMCCFSFFFIQVFTLFYCAGWSLSNFRDQSYQSTIVCHDARWLVIKKKRKLIIGIILCRCVVLVRNVKINEEIYSVTVFQHWTAPAVPGIPIIKHVHQPKHTVLHTVTAASTVLTIQGKSHVNYVVPRQNT